MKGFDICQKYLCLLWLLMDLTRYQCEGIILGVAIESVADLNSEVVPCMLRLWILQLISHHSVTAGDTLWHQAWEQIIIQK